MKRIAYIHEIKEWEQGFDFFVPLKVRFYETDMFGHLNNTVTFSYFETARIELFKSLGFMEDWARTSGTSIPVVADLQCDYLAQIFFDEDLKVYAKVATIGNSSIDIHYMAKKADGTTAFTGRGTIVQIDRTTGKPLPWDLNMRDKLESI